MTTITFTPAPTERIAIELHEYAVNPNCWAGLWASDIKDLSIAELDWFLPLAIAIKSMAK